MTKFLLNKLADDYPNLFYYKNDSRYPISKGIQSYDGWYNLIKTSCRKLNKLKNSHRIRITQITNEFGYLDIKYHIINLEDELNEASKWYKIFIINLKRLFLYLHFNKKITIIKHNVDNIIQETKNHSMTQCELCGSNEKKGYSAYWNKTLCLKCVEHYDNLSYEKNQ